MEESCPTRCHGSVKVSHLNDQGLGVPSSQNVKEDSVPIEGVAHTQSGTYEYCINVTTNNGEFSSQFLELAELYFEDMAGDVLKACHSDKALIYFKSAGALEKALATTVHSIDDKLTVTVSKCELQSQPKPGTELNGPNSISKGGCKSPSQESKSLPEDSPVPRLSNDGVLASTCMQVPVMVGVMDKALADYVSNNNFSELREYLNSCNCLVHGVCQSGGTLVFQYMSPTPSFSKLVEKQLQHIITSVQGFLSTFSSSVVTMANDTWACVPQNELSRHLSATSLKLSVTDDEEYQVKRVTAAGKASEVKCFTKQLYALMKTAEAKLHVQSRQITTKATHIDGIKIALLEASAYEEKVNKFYPDLQIVLNKDAGFIELTGDCVNVCKLLSNVYKDLRSIGTADYVAPSQLVADCFQEQWLLAAVQRKWSEAGACAVLQASALTVTVWCKSERSLEKAVQIVGDAVSECSFVVAPEVFPLVDISLKSSTQNCAKFSFDMNNSVLNIACLTDTLPDVKAKVQAFINALTPVTKSVAADSGQVRYIMSYCKNELEKFESQHDGSSERVALTILALPPAGFNVKGCAKDVISAESLLKSLVQQVQKQDKCIRTAAGGSDCLKDQLSMVEKKTLTIIEMCHGKGGTSSNTRAPSGLRGDAEYGQLETPSRLKKEPVDPTPAGLQSLGSDTVKTPQNLCFQIIKGSLSEQEADVLVNSVDQTGQLVCGAISKALLIAAGSGLQDEITRSYPNGIGTNAFVVTSGRRLKCKHVFHVALEIFGGRSSEQVIYDLILSCLKEAHGRSLNSIAFPAIGTGVLGYPLHIAADKFHSAVEAFSAEYPYTTLKRIICVAFDSPTHKAFKDRMDLWLSAGAVSPASSSSTLSAINRAQSRGSADVSNVDSVEEVAMASSEQRMLSEEGQAIVIEGLQLHFVVGDIADERTDVIVNSTTPDLYLGGAVSKALLKKGGDDLKRVCRNAGIVDKSRALVTSPGRLSCKHLMHLDVVGVYTNTDYEKLVAAALKKANELEAKSLAMPALGVSPGQSVGALAKGLAGALVKFCTSHRSRHLELLRVVLTNDGMHKDLHSAVRGTPELEEIAAIRTSSSSVKGMPLAGAPHVHTSQIKRSIPEEALPESNDVWVTIYGSTESVITAAYKELQSCLSNSMICQEISLDSGDIGRLTDAQMEEIKRLCKTQHIQVTVMKDNHCICIQGYSKDSVTNMQDCIKEFLHKAARKTYEYQADRDMMQMVQWQYKGTTGSWCTFDGAVNSMVEKAHAAGQRNVQLSDSDSHVVHFPSMTLSSRDGSVWTLRRCDMLKFQEYPPEWTLEENLQLVNLKPDTEEYQKVEADFKKSVGTSVKQVLEIKRFQDPLLWRQYLAQRARINRSNTTSPHNRDNTVELERKLWHGTGRDGVENILRGLAVFNRSFTGPTALYGNGVYFARDASIAAQPQYTIPDRNGNKHVILACVLTGEYVKGTPGLRAPPYKHKSVQTYDTTVNDETTPTIFVVYHDTQAYPMYVIKFQ